MGPMEQCPCSSGQEYAVCCAPYHLGSRQAETPEVLMRSRYSGYALGLDDYVLRTWHPRTRPDRIEPSPGLVWTGLEVLDAEGDQVEFIAHCTLAAVPTDLRERSTFAQRAGRWFYLAGVVED